MMDLNNGVPGVNAPDPTTYEEFWPYYVSQHMHPATRAVHAVATTVSIVVGVTGMLLRKPKLVAIAPLLAYGPAFASHPLFEGNKPATLGGNSFWAALADLQQVAKFYGGTLEDDVGEVRKACGLRDGELTLADAKNRPADLRVAA